MKKASASGQAKVSRQLQRQGAGVLSGAAVVEGTMIARSRYNNTALFYGEMEGQLLMTTKCRHSVDTYCTYLQASTTFCSQNRHGSGANLVAMTGCVPVCFMKSCRNSSDSPKPYTCTQGTLYDAVALDQVVTCF